MPLGKNVSYVAKRINAKEYIRLAYQNGKVVESKIKKYK